MAAGRDSGKGHLVFVYGTLMRGMVNHEDILLDAGSAEFVDAGGTQDSFSMYCHLVPYADPSEPRYQLLGEVYRVDDAVLGRLDRIEGHPTFFCRRQYPVVLRESRKLVRPWIYVNEQMKRFPGSNVVLWNNGDFRSYVLYNERRDDRDG